MIKNRIKQKWAAGEPVANGWLAIGNQFTAEIVASAGFDSLTIDLQHGFLDYNDARGMMQAMTASGTPIIARVPWREPGIVMKMLDAGAYGIICPMVNTPEEAAELVSLVRYPPKGNRSYGPTRANFAAGPGYAVEANDEIIVLAMIETGEAYRNVDAICATPGLDGIYIGPSDLTLGLTQGRLPAGLDREEPEMVEAIQHVLESAKAAGIRAALHCLDPTYGVKAIGWGFDMVTIAMDVPILTQGVKSALSRFRDHL